MILDSDYKIISARYPDDLANEVNKYLLDGYDLAGGVCINSVGTLYQAIYKIMVVR